MANKFLVKGLIRDLEKIEHECIPSAAGGGDNKGESSSTDPFQMLKKTLTLNLKELQDGVKEYEELREQGRSKKVIELKSNNTRLLEQCKEEFNELKKLYDKETRKRKKAYNDEELEGMKQYVDLFSETIKELDDLHNNRKKETTPNYARKMIEERKKQREKLDEKFDAPAKEVVLSDGTKAFIQRKEDFIRDNDQKLDQIYDGVVGLKNIAADINQELKVQDVMLNDLENNIDRVTDKYKASNKRIKKLIEASGGTSRWCVLLILFPVLLGLFAYMVNPI